MLHSLQNGRWIEFDVGQRGIMKQRNPMEIIADVCNKVQHAYRSPMGGFFVPEIRVGEIIQSGRLLGYIQDQ